MKKSVLLFLTLILLTPSLAFSGIITIKIGFFIPRADSDLWQEEFRQMDFGKSHYYNSNFCFTYEYFVTKQLSFTLGIDGYLKNKSGIYNGYFGVLGSVFGEEVDFAFPNGLEGDFFANEMFSIIHNFNVSITPIQFSMKLYPMGRQGKIMPYIGGGVGLYIWYVRLEGDWVDFNDDTWVYGVDTQIYPVYLTYAREDSRFTIGYQGFAGIMIPVAQRFTFEAEFKYNYAQANFRTGSDASFTGYDAFDLSGYQFSLGLNYWF
ncbi:MAG: hypothetical protein PVF66_01205 [Candidatus Aminicenantes bacterium]|jgi:hypothetical protein